MDVTANLTTPGQLDNWMQANVQRTTASADEWCYAMTNGYSLPACPDPVLFGFPGTTRSQPISSDTFLSALRKYQLNVNAATPGPGGSPNTATPAPAPAPAPVSAAAGVGQGVLGMTNCAVCQQLAANPALLVVIGLALYFLFKK